MVQPPSLWQKVLQDHVAIGGSCVANERGRVFELTDTDFVVVLESSTIVLAAMGFLG